MKSILVLAPLLATLTACGDDPPVAPPSGSPAPQVGEGTDGAPPAQAPRPRAFSELTDGQPTIRLEGKVEGMTGGQVEFTVVETREEGARPRVLHLERVTDGTFSVLAPASYPEPIYVIATAFDADGKPIPGQAAAANLAEPIRLEGADQVIELKLGVTPPLPFLGSGEPGSAEPGFVPWGGPAIGAPPTGEAPPPAAPVPDGSAAPTAPEH